MPNEEELRSAIEKAESLHGHLGPFLVIGVRMGILAKKVLDDGKDWNPEVVARVPLTVPFTCVLDGIQSSTRCTVGNQRLRVESSDKGICATFRRRDMTGRRLNVTAKHGIVDYLTREISKDARNEELAWKIARMQESELFKMELSGNSAE